MKRLFTVSCLVPLAGLLFAGCGEDPVTSPDRTMLSDQTTYTPLETIQVPATGETMTSTNVLQSGVLYQVRVSGTVNIGGPGSGTADAEFADFSNVPNSVISSCDNSGTMVDIGLSIDDATDDNLKSPTWGEFDNAHTYTYDIMGTGQPLSFKFHDCNYSDNSGNLTVMISRASEPNYQPLETILVPADGTPRTSSTVLQSGVTYKILVSGTVNVGGQGSGTADAEFADFSNVPTSLVDDCMDATNAQVDIGLAINDSQLDASKLPNWGEFNSGHVYRIDYVGTGAPITLGFHDCNYSDNSGNLVVQILGPSIQPPTPPPSGNFQTVETVQVPANCSTVMSTTVLQSGLTYQIRVSGTVNTGNGIMADAEFADFSNLPTSLLNNCDNSATGIDIGLAINDTQMGQTKAPNWGTFKTNHTYVTTIQGTGQPISLSFHDCDCSDNSGFLSVEIRAPRNQGNGQGPQLDVRPGSARNFINPKSHGMITVAVLGADGFDVNSVAVSSLGLAAEGSSNAAKPMHTRVRDVNQDGIPDLVMQFKIDQLNIQQGDTQLCLSGLVVDGQSTQVCDTIELVGRGRNF
jgi:hypothetical protein